MNHKPTDGDVLNELFTGECEAPEDYISEEYMEEPADEQDRRVSGPTFAESQQRLANALDMLTVLALRKPE